MNILLFGVSLDADERELQQLARDGAEYYFRDKQEEESDVLIDEVGALLTESGGAQPKVEAWD